MADQADWPDIYIDASAAGGGDGSQSSPYNSFSQINWTIGGDNSVYDWYDPEGSGPTASVTINLKRGEVWEERLLTGCDGTATYPIIIQPYGTGDNPLIDGVIDVSTASYKWTLSQGGTNEYYLEDAAGGDPGIYSPNQAFLDGVRCWLWDSIGALRDHGFAWGHNAADEAAPNSKGVYNTVYIRDDSGDPDTQGTLVEVTNGIAEYLVYLRNHYITLDGVDVSRSDGHGVRFVNGFCFCVAKNLVVSDNYYAGLQIYAGANDCEWNNVEAYGSIGPNFGGSGNFTDRVERLLITGCKSHDPAVRYAAYTEAEGIKAFGFLNCTIEKSQWYNCPSGGIRLDGTATPEIYGCIGTTVQFNEFWNNGGIEGNYYAQMEIEWSRQNLVQFNYFHDPWNGGPNLVLSHSESDNNVILCNILTGSYASFYQGSLTLQTYSGDAEGKENVLYGNIIYGANQGIRITSGAWTILRNNIVAGSIGVDLYIGDATFPQTLDSDYNCFTGEGTNGPVRVVTTNYTLATWRTLTDGYGNLCDEHSFSDDPLFTDPDNDDFTLQAGSPCIGNADSTLGSPYDIGLLPGSSWPSGVLTADRDDY